jgi:hypothetical protein
MVTIRCKTKKEAKQWIKLKKKQGYKGVRIKGKYKDGSIRVVYY